MLLLNRKLGERVFICNDIVVTVIDVRGDRVKLGFQCPKNIPVLREEIYLRNAEDRSIAALTNPATESPFIPEFA